MTNRKMTIVAVLLIVALCIRIGVYKYNEAQPDTSDIQADVQISAMAIMETYESNEPHANDLYLNKYVDVTGTIAKIVTDEKCSLYLKTNSMLGFVIAELSDCSITSDIREGSSVTVRGLCSGYLSDVILVRSVLANS